MDILETLWRGDLAPSTDYARIGGGYNKLVCKLSDEIEALETSLSEENKKRLRKITDLQLEADDVGCKAIFADAFRMGARIMLAILREDGNSS